MAKVLNYCKNCNKKFITYFPDGYKEFCCFGCEYDYKWLEDNGELNKEEEGEEE